MYEKWGGGQIFCTNNLGGSQILRSRETEIFHPQHMLLTPPLNSRKENPVPSSLRFRGKIDIPLLNSHENQ